MTDSRVSDCDALLIALQAKHGDWLEDAYSMRMMVHSRVADLRKRGYKIECKKFGRKDYRYRLIQNGGKGQ